MGRSEWSEICKPWVLGKASLLMFIIPIATDLPLLSLNPTESPFFPPFEGLSLTQTAICSIRGQSIDGKTVQQSSIDAVPTVLEISFSAKIVYMVCMPLFLRIHLGLIMQVLQQVSVALAVYAFLLVIGIFVAAIVRDKGVGYAFIISSVVYVSVVPIGIPVVTGTVLAIGAREIAKEKAIVSR